MRVSFCLSLGLLSVFLGACAATDTSRWEAREPEVVSWEEGCQDSTTLELLCSEDTCAFFHCRDLTEALSEISGEVEPALISRRVHLRLHSGGPRGGMWNAEWQQFVRGRRRATPEEIWEHAIKLIIKYDLAEARMVPYR